MRFRIDGIRLAAFGWRSGDAASHAFRIAGAKTFIVEASEFGLAATKRREASIQGGLTAADSLPDSGLTTEFIKYPWQGREGNLYRVYKQNRFEKTLVSAAGSSHAIRCYAWPLVLDRFDCCVDASDRPYGTGPVHSSRGSATACHLQRDYAELPVSLEVFEIYKSGETEAWAEEITSYIPENTQTHPGVFAFRSGIVRKGSTYEARTNGSGMLELEFLPVVDKSSAPHAVQVGMSWLARTADAWLSNQPRHGAVLKEGRYQHPEAQACIACHITQFSTRAYFTALSNGYSDNNSSSIERIMQRMRNNPRPLYGHPGVNWSRVIHSARTVLKPPAGADEHAPGSHRRRSVNGSGTHTWGARFSVAQRRVRRGKTPVRS